MSAEDGPIRLTASSPGGVSFRRVKEGSVRFSPDVTRREYRHHATSPTTGQTRPHSSPSKGRFFNATPPSNKTANGTNSETSSSTGNSDDSGSPSSSMGKSPNLFPLTGFLRLLLEQEKMMWGRNELLLKALKNEPAKEGARALSEASERFSDGGSVFTSSTTTLEHTDPTEQAKEPLYFIRYGQLTGLIHKYFKKLEKRHACLHLTARRARHETIRHVERTVGGAQDHPEEPPSVGIPQATVATTAPVVILRDDDLLVYRCALMCSQFPMLSAPSPPDGQSPTPPPPPLPSIFTTDALEYSQTAPTGQIAGPYLHSNDDASDHTDGKYSTSSVTSSERYRGGGASRPANGAPAQPHLEKQSSSEPRPHAVGTSDPIPIKGGKARTKNKSIRRHSGMSTSTVDSASLAKLPPGDSDEEAELVKLVSSKTSSGGESSPSTGREHPFTPMVNREMLYSLVRRAFKQTEEQQVNFETNLKREYGRRSKGEILAKELAGQLQVLDNNAHPFYKPKLFVTRNGYDLWLQGEKERVRALIDKFWHCSLPRPQLWRNYNPTDYHRLYTILLQKLIDCESRTDRKEPVHSGKTPSSSLSPTAQRLLTEFGLRYGVGELYRRIVYLEYLAKHFDYEIWYIKHCTEELRVIRSLLPRNRKKITAVRPEMEVLRSTIHLLHGQTDNSLTRIDRLFLEADPRKGVASLIELLAEVLDAQQNLFGKRIQPVEKWLKRYLKSGFVLRYERRKEIASDETIGTAATVQPFVLTPTLVNSLLLDTRDEVYEFRDKYQSVFRPYFDVVPFSKVEFYRLLCADACSLCARKLHKEANRKTLSLEMLGLMYRLNERDIEWQGVIEPEHQLWRQHFQNLACTWLDVLGQQISDWTVLAVENDQWTLLAFDGPPLSLMTSLRYGSAGGEGLGHAPHSSWPQDGAAQNPHILTSIRVSPFPSPLMPPGGASPIGGSVIGGATGAFMPYRQLVKRHKTSPVLSESSGAVTDSLTRSPPLETSSSTSITGSEVPHLFQGSKDRNRGSPVSIVTFGQKRKVENRVVSSELTPPPQEIEVSVSVYSGSEGEEEVAGGVGGAEGQDGEGEAPSLSVPKHLLSPKTASSEYVSCVSEFDVSATPPDPHPTAQTTHPPENGQTGQLPSPPVPTTPSKFNNLLDSCNAEDSDTVKPKPRVPPPPNLATVYQAADNAAPRGEDDPPSPSSTPLSSLEGGSPIKDYRHYHGHSPLNGMFPSPLGMLAGGEEQLQSYLFPISNSPMDVVTMLSRLASFTGELLLVLTPKIRKTSFERSKLPSPDEFSSEVNKARQQASERLKSARNIKTAFLKKLNKIFISCLKLYADNLVCMDLCGWSSTEAIKLLGDQQLYHLNRRKDAGEIWGCRHMVEARHGMHPNGIPCSKKQTDNFEHITRDMCIRINNIHVLITIFHSLEDHLYSLIRTDSKKPITAFGYVSSDHSEATPNLSLLRGKTNKPHPSRTRYKPGSVTSVITSEQRDTVSWPSSVSTGLGPMEPDPQQSLGGRTHLADGTVGGDGAGGNTGGKKAESADDKDTPPRQSLECLEYLKKMQDFQVRMIAIRMNKFCKIALFELLGLRLECSIEKRLFPVVDYLERHRVALKKYVYPECFSAIMEHVWECLLQDLEDAAVQLRISKRPVTDRAQMLLQALSHLIQFMHNWNNGLDLDKLNSTSEYLQGLLDIMTRSTDQLIHIFNKLNNAHFTRNMLDLSQAPVVVDSQVLSQLRLQLRSNKKCFTGHEFVNKVMQIGQGSLVDALDDETTAERSSSAPGSHVLSPTGQPIEYNEEYACAVAQYLLDERILMHVTDMPSLSDGSSVLVTPDQNTDDEDGRGSHIASSYETKDLTDSVRPLGVNSAVSFVSGLSDAMSADSPSQGRLSAASSRRGPSAASQDPFLANSRSQRYGSSSRGNRRQVPHQQLDKPHFIPAATVYYKFAGSEDSEFAFSQNQILVSSIQTSSRHTSLSSGSGTNSSGGHSAPNERLLHSSRHSLGSLREENRDFDAARQGTLCLVYDLLTQRARKERVAKQFITSPMVQEQRRQAGRANCDLIFKM